MNNIFKKLGKPKKFFHSNSTMRFLDLKSKTLRAKNIHKDCSFKSEHHSTYVFNELLDNYKKLSKIEKLYLRKKGFIKE